MPATASYQPALSGFRPSANTGATSARDYWCIGKDKIIVPNLNGHMRDFIGSFHHALPEDHKVINLESYRNFQTESPFVLEIYDLAKDASQDVVPNSESTIKAA